MGNLYDNPKYSTKRDLAFSIFYMCINIGRFLRPVGGRRRFELFPRQKRVYL